MHNRVFFGKVLTDVEHLQKGLDVDNSVQNKAQVRKEEKFDSKPDPTIVRIGTKDFVDKTSLEEAICEWLSDADL